jgi:hypothetical protein
MNLIEKYCIFIHVFNSNHDIKEYLIDNDKLYFLIKDPLIK